MPAALQLQAGAESPHWLPLALRARLTTDVDVRAVALALEAIARDGVARCVNLSPASLADASLAPRLRALLFAAPRAARQLAIEVAEAAALDHFAPLQQLGRQLRPCGVQMGLEHAGNGLGRIDRLFEIGLDFIKLDASATRGIALEPQRADFVRASVELLHRMSQPVYAEGVVDADDAQMLWRCGIDGITGPWASAQRPQWLSRTSRRRRAGSQPIAPQCSSNTPRRRSAKKYFSVSRTVRNAISSQGIASSVKSRASIDSGPGAKWVSSNLAR
jgi:EAL domain-containing protein (putative c-di-GMP-specific phosphodiesterase class I)